jgi:hypothetical protein
MKSPNSGSFSRISASQEHSPAAAPVYLAKSFAEVMARSVFKARGGFLRSFWRETPCDAFGGARFTITPANTNVTLNASRGSAG